jgi:hypothetical protein
MAVSTARCVHHVLIAGACVAVAACDGDTPDIVDGLVAAGVEVSEVFPDEREPGARYFDLWFTQPIDHGVGDGGGTFEQYAALIHFDGAAPTVFYTSGYGANRLRTRGEITRMVDGNQLSVEYRFYRSSLPEPPDWQYLDVAQASADFHAVVGAVRPLYDGPWIHTGGSKGGETVLHSRYLYPDDFDAGVAYVTPVRIANPDTRFATVLDQIGEPTCRQRLRDAQVEIAARRAAMVARATASGAPFTVLGVDYATEIAMVEIEWSFWQYRGIGACGAIPDTTATDDELGQFFDDTSPPSAYSDLELADAYWGFVYQAMTELGYPVFDHDHIPDNLTMYDYQDLTPFLPPGVDGASLVFDPSFNQALLAWAADDPGALIIVDGEWDPWSAGAVTVGGDARRYVAPQASHGARIAELAPADRADAIDRLARWLDVPVADPIAPQKTENVRRSAKWGD